MYINFFNFKSNKYNLFFNKLTIILIAIILIIAILLSIGLTENNYLGWLKPINYNPQLIQGSFILSNSYWKFNSDIYKGQLIT